MRAWIPLNFVKLEPAVKMARMGFIVDFLRPALNKFCIVNRSMVLQRVVTIDMTLQYVAGGEIGLPLLAGVQLIQEAGQTGFTRGVLKQEGRALSSFTATLRKLPEA